MARKITSNKYILRNKRTKKLNQPKEEIVNNQYLCLRKSYRNRCFRETTSVNKENLRYDFFTQQTYTEELCHSCIDFKELSNSLHDRRKSNLDSMATYFHQNVSTYDYGFINNYDWVTAPPLFPIPLTPLPVTPVTLITPPPLLATVCPFTPIVPAPVLITTEVVQPIYVDTIPNISITNLPFPSEGSCVDPAVDVIDENSFFSYDEDNSIYNYYINDQPSDDNDNVPDPINFYLNLPKDLFPSAKMFNLDPNPMIDEFCKESDILENSSWILDLEFGIPRMPITRPIAVYDVQYNSIHCKNTPGAIHPGFENCNQEFQRTFLYYYDSIVSSWYRGFVVMNHDKSVENFQSWLLIPMQVLGMCWA